MSFTDRQTAMIAKVAGAEFDTPPPSPLEEAASTILVSLANRASSKIAGFVEAVLEAVTGWVKKPVNPFTKKADPPKEDTNGA